MKENQAFFLHLTSLTPEDSGNYSCEYVYAGHTKTLHLNITVEEDEEAHESQTTVIASSVIGVTELEDIEPYSTFTQRQCGLYSTIKEVKQIVLYSGDGGSILGSSSPHIDMSFGKDIEPQIAPNSWVMVTCCTAAELSVLFVHQWRKMLKFLILTSLLLEACTSQITGYGNRTADYGGDAHYHCTLQNPTGVLQVTWQRLFKDKSIENLATYSGRFGEQVNDPYQQKLMFTKASLNSTSIVFRNLTWEDESCYICSFNVYPDGSQRRQICLTVQGISKVETGVQVPSREQEDKDVIAVFSCSATGKPAPTIQWQVSPPAIGSEEAETITITNSDHTFTSSSNITLKVSANWRGNVNCLVNKGRRGQRQELIRFPLREGNIEDTKEGGGWASFWIAFAIIVVVVSCVIVTVVIKRKK
ncbi:OX-2 membrane glycoprotein-like [Scomber japonicus]|uniref:OX-2 membrane glycoprotein-like n=1 Tax=Scomber japonicus TaxID=13676 RepID=UPI002305DB31|nr:OX-2 membrane glycoprotein-like [Scomber japonicus]